MPDFLDSNVVIYAHSADDPAKARVAESLLLRPRRELVISAQVLSECASAFLHKAKQRPEDVLATLEALQHLRTVETDALLVSRAVQAHAVYGLHFYDGMIVAAAERAGCLRLLSEDFNAGQRYFGVLAVNPFE